MNEFWDKIEGAIEGFVGNEIRYAIDHPKYKITPDFPNFLLIKSHMGSGKTITTMKKLEEDKLNWIYLAPKHDNIIDNLILSTIRKFDFIHLQGRGFLCDIDYYRKIAKHIDIRPICDNLCTLKDAGCPYYERKKQLYENPKSWAGVHQHITSYLPEFFRMWKDKKKITNYYDVIVVDESPISIFHDIRKAHPKSLTKLKQQIKQLKLEDLKTDLVIEFIDYLILEYYNENGLDYNRIMKYFRKINFNKFYDYFQQNLVEFIRNTDTNPKQLEFRQNYLELFSIMELKASKKTLPYMITKQEKGDFNKKGYYLSVFRNSPLVDSPLPVIGLDGTANIDIWKTIVGEKPTILDKNYEYKNIYQLKSQGNARYPFTSWVRMGYMTETGKRLCRLIDKFCKTKKSNVLLATTIPLRKKIKQEITAKNVKYCHFYSLRGMNDYYEKSDSMIIICEPNVPPFVIENLSKLSNWDETVWRQVFTQEEILQAVGRIREDLPFAPNGRKREKCEIIIFPWATYPNGELLFPEAILKEEYELKYYFKNGVFPDSITDKKGKILDWMPVDTPVFRKEIRKYFHENYGWSYNNISDYINELISEGKVYDGGRTGVKRIFKFMEVLW